MSSALIKFGIPGIVLLVALVALVPGANPNLNGPAKVVDGATLVVAGETVHLFGIDTPDLAQTCRTEDGAEWPCGRNSAEALAKLIGDQPVGCEARGRDERNRRLAQCWVNGRDLAAMQARTGWALADHGTRLGYASEEGNARFIRSGLWRGPFETPAEWRRSHP